MRIFKLASDRKILETLRAKKMDLTSVTPTVLSIIQEVREKGDEALKRYAKEFDQRELESILVSRERREGAKVDPSLKEALLMAKDNILKFHETQMPKEKWIEISPGIRAGFLVRPIEKVGCYVPGGKYPLLSTVLMTVLPAKVAGVKGIVVCTPKASPEILFACNLAGVDQVFEVGGAGAIAAMAYGTQTIPKVNKIVGPGNRYVSAAKKAVYGEVGIDFLAGPSEVVIIADDKGNPSYIAADLLAQAEHGPTSLSVLITPCERLASQVVEEIERMLLVLSTREIARMSLQENGAILLVESWEEAFAVSNFLAPEHVEIHCHDPKWLKLIENAGSIFLGENSPEAAGDYATGPNHVVPTGGMAAAVSGLSVKDFIKTPTVQALTQEGLKTVAKAVVTLAKAEGLEGHAKSITVRIKNVT